MTAVEVRIMQVKLPVEKSPYPARQEGSVPRKALRLENLKSAEPEQEPSPPVIAEAEPVPELDKEAQKKAMTHAVELFSMFDRKLKYEILEDSGIVQMQVIDASNGRVVRKIPADEVIKFIKAVKEQIDDRVDVLG
jgi:uncharacterized FlaG/YvyC family protein